MFMMRGPNIFLNVYVVDPDATEDDVIIIEYNDGDE
jgi:hypothetical protein